jgi:hypothetical protein
VPQDDQENSNSSQALNIVSMPEYSETDFRLRLRLTGRRFALSLDRVAPDGFRWPFDHGIDMAWSFRTQFVRFGERAFSGGPIPFRLKTIVLLDAASLVIEIGALHSGVEVTRLPQALSAVTMPGITASIHAGLTVSTHEVPLLSPSW